MHSVKIRDIAKAVGVSPSTVTRAINNNGYVSEENRRRIGKAIKELGYVPNKVARGLRNRKTNFIGHVLPLNSANPFMTQMGTAFNAAAEAEGYHVLTVCSRDSSEKERVLIEDLVGMMVEAIVFTTQTLCETEVIRWVLAQDIQVVMIERPRILADIDTVLLGSFEGAVMATERLVLSGHKDVAFIGVPRERHFVDAQRQDGFLSVMKENDLLIKPHWNLMMEDYSVEQGYAAMESILASGDLPTGIFATSDLFACGVSQCLYKHGIRIPEDISLIGYDNTLSGVCSPPITSIEHQANQVGMSAISMIAERRNGLRTVSKTITLGPGLVERGSVRSLL